ncbi:MAG TPA: glycosyltransferase, partial [Chloroflexota bacterium]|nr:glycosyltransferase [Chloroflexota bacterium]
LPVLEALASATPTLISNDPALLEVAGPESAYAVSPTSLTDIAHGMHTLLTDARLRARLGRQGPARAARFTWDSCARQTLSVYRAAVGDQTVELNPAIAR